ncbi:hypothetical protein [Bacteroides oleiciplenus]|uniref:hypothetical protein n=1 Tax=Bacteroides oleiciplenus TaxID=626931 RepID=UPI0011DD6DFA|nr:hypothetical protein [Bacteroides oleiciplenus]
MFTTPVLLLGGFFVFAYLCGMYLFLVVRFSIYQGSPFVVCGYIFAACSLVPFFHFLAFLLSSVPSVFTGFPFLLIVFRVGGVLAREVLVVVLFAVRFILFLLEFMVVGPSILLPLSGLLRFFSAAVFWPSFVLIFFIPLCFIMLFRFVVLCGLVI